jgi:hypothetical protein
MLCVMALVMTQSQTLVMTSGLDLLWPHERLGCDRIYPPRDPDSSPPASQVHARVVPRLCGRIRQGLVGGDRCLIR